MVRFFLDESLPPQLAEALRTLGYEALHAIEAGLAGAPDETIYDKAGEPDAVLVTLDLDFSDIRRFAGETPVIVVRFRGPANRREIVEFVTSRFVRYRAEIDELRGAVMILEPRRSRIRRKY